MSTFWIIYSIIGFFWGYLHARNVYKPDGPRHSGEMPAESIPWALGSWIVYGMIWPVPFVILAVAMFFAIVPKNVKRGSKRFADRIFGV